MALIAGVHPEESHTQMDHVPYLLPLGFGLSGCLGLGLRRSGCSLSPPDGVVLVDPEYLKERRGKLCSSYPQCALWLLILCFPVTSHGSLCPPYWLCA